MISQQTVRVLLGSQNGRERGAIHERSYRLGLKTSQMVGLVVIGGPVGNSGLDLVEKDFKHDENGGIDGIWESDINIGK